MTRKKQKERWALHMSLYLSAQWLASSSYEVQLVNWHWQDSCDCHFWLRWKLSGPIRPRGPDRRPCPCLRKMGLPAGPWHWSDLGLFSSMALWVATLSAIHGWPDAGACKKQQAASGATGERVKERESEFPAVSGQRMGQTEMCGWEMAKGESEKAGEGERAFFPLCH